MGLFGGIVGVAATVTVVVVERDADPARLVAGMHAHADGFPGPHPGLRPT